MNKENEYIDRLIKRGDHKAVINYLIKELKLLRVLIGTMREDNLLAQQQMKIRKAENNGKLPYIFLPGELDS